MLVPASAVAVEVIPSLRSLLSCQATHIYFMYSDIKKRVTYPCFREEETKV